MMWGRRLEGKRMASGIIGNDVPRKGLRVRVPCLPLGGKFEPPLTQPFDDLGQLSREKRDFLGRVVQIEADS